MKKLYIFLLLILAILGAYWLAYGVNPIKKIFSKSSTDTSDTTTSDTTSTTGEISSNSTPAAQAFLKSPAPVKDSRGFPLSVGSTGTYVKMIQEALNTRFGSSLVVDGILGTKTAKALSTHGFNPDAIYYKHFNEIVGYTYWT